MTNLLKHVWTIAIVGILLAACGKTTNEQTNVIPKDAFYVMHVDAGSLIKKSEWNIFENAKLSKQIEFFKVALDEKSTKLFDAFMKDANAFGVDVKGDAFGYVSPSSAGLVLKMNDAQKLKEVLLTFNIADAESLVEKDGAYAYRLDRRNAIAWNKNTFMLISTEMNRSFGGSSSVTGLDGEDVEIQDYALVQLKQKAENSINSLPGFSDFLADVKDISIYSHLDVNSYEHVFKYSMLPKEMTDALKDFDGLASGSYISFDKGEISVSSKSYFKDSDTEKKFNDLAESLMDKMKGEQMKYLEGNPLLGLSASLKGDGLKEYLQKMGLWKILEENVGSELQIADKVITNLQGDVSFVISDVTTIEQEYEGWGGEMRTYTKQVPQMAFFADCKDGKTLMDLIKGLIPEEALSSQGSGFEKVNDNVYKIDVEGMTAYCGVKDNMFFCTNVQAIYDNIQAGKKKDNIVSDLTKGNYMAVAGDLQLLKGVLSSINGNFSNQYVNQFIDMFDSYYATSESIKEGKGKVKMRNQDKNSLAQLCHFIDNLILTQI